MKKSLLKSTIYIAIITLVNGCSSNYNKTLNAIQGKWYSPKDNTIIIEIRSEKWIEGDDNAGYTTFLITPKNDTIFSIKVVEQKNIYTNYKVGMEQAVKILEYGDSYMHYAYVAPQTKTEFCELVVRDTITKVFLRRPCKYHATNNTIATN